jgi:SHOCT-like domain
MSENQKKILQMLAEGKISVSEAERLLSLITSAGNNRGDPNNVTTGKTSPRFLHVVVEPKPGASPEHRHGKVNVRVPFGLIRAGMKLATLIPPEAADKVNDAMKDKGMSFDMRHLKPEDIEDLISALHDSEVNIDSDDETVRVYAE